MAASQPLSPQAFERAVAAYRAGNLLESERLCQQIVAARRDSFEPFHLLAVVQMSLGKFDAALGNYDRALALRPNHPDALFDRGNALHNLKRYDDALVSYDRLLLLQPNHYGAAFNRGNALKKLKRYDEALASYRRAVALQPGIAGMHLAFGQTLHELGATDDALVQYGAALAPNPSAPEARLARCMAQLPPIYTDAAEIPLRRKAFEDELRMLSAEVGQAIPLPAFAKVVGSSRPFFLAYQGEDDRALQSLYGQLMCRAMAAAYPPVALSAAPKPGERIRVGIVSGFFLNHSN